MADSKIALTVGGLPGTGTSTACQSLERRLGLPYVYAGRIFREQAEKAGMSLAAYGALAETTPDIDRALDARQADLLRGPPLILEGRLSGYLAFRDRLPSLKVWFTCDAYVRARRIVDREGGDVDARLFEMRRREESERKRYLAYYGFDLNDLSVYDVVLDTSELTKAQVAEAVATAYERATRRRAWWRPWAR